MHIDTSRLLATRIDSRIASALKPRNTGKSPFKTARGPEGPREGYPLKFDPYVHASLYVSAVLRFPIAQSTPREVSATFDTNGRRVPVHKLAGDSLTIRRPAIAARCVDAVASRDVIRHAKCARCPPGLLSENK